MDVPRAPTHLVETRRLEAVLHDRTAHDRVESDVRKDLAGVGPHLTAVLGLDHPRRLILQRLREAALEGVLRLDDVIVDGDDRPATGLARRLRQERDLAFAIAAAGDGEVGLALEVFEIGHGWSSLGDGKSQSRILGNRLALGRASGSG